jgi:hypothetical protein
MSRSFIVSTFAKWLWQPDCLLKTHSKGSSSFPSPTLSHSIRTLLYFSVFLDFLDSRRELSTFSISNPTWKMLNYTARWITWLLQNVFSYFLFSHGWHFDKSEHANWFQRIDACNYYATRSLCPLGKLLVSCLAEGHKFFLLVCTSGTVGRSKAEYQQTSSERSNF